MVYKLHIRVITDYWRQRTTVGYATTNDPATNERHKEEFLSRKPGCYNEQTCYKDREE